MVNILLITILRLDSVLSKVRYGHYMFLHVLYVPYLTEDYFC